MERKTTIYKTREARTRAPLKWSTRPLSRTQLSRGALTSARPRSLQGRLRAKKSSKVRGLKKAEYTSMKQVLRVTFSFSKQEFEQEASAIVDNYLTDYSNLEKKELIPFLKTRKVKKEKIGEYSSMMPKTRKISFKGRKSYMLSLN